MSTTLMTEPGAGWYPDPAGGSAWRWWDGATWTEHLRAADTGPVPLAAVPAAATAQTGPVRVDPVQGGPAQVGPVQTGPVQAAPMQAAPVQAAPVPPAVPQPGEAAAPPAAASAGSQASATVDIPVTDQMYWHSGAAEMIEIPRLPHQTISGGLGGGGRQQPGYVRDWQDLGSPQTAGIWLLAALPLMSIPIGGVIGVVFAIGGLPFANLAAMGVVLGLSWVFGYLDQRALGERGYHPPSIWWMLLLPPLAYFIARGRSVRRENMRAWPPELLYVASVLLITAALFLSAYSVAVQTGLLPVG